MAANEFDVELFERRLHTLKDSQESIQSLSAWCLERRQHHKKIVATWLQVLKKVKVEHRLTLFYLANDVIQYSKRKNFEFVESWGTTLQRATTMVRDEKVKHRILRIFKIWDQRQVYDEEFLADLSGLISAAPKKKTEPTPSVPEEFQAPLLISTMRSCATLEQATDARLRDLRESNIDIENAEELCSSLKDRRRVEDAEREVELAVRNVENYVRALEAEIRERTQVLELLEQADQFYETQRGEVKIVTNAYRNFGSRVKNLKKKLDELLPTFVSPIPSPDVNAPSPSPDSDIDLPGDENQVANQSTIIEVAPPSLYGSYSHEYDALPPTATSEVAPGNDSADFTNNFASFIGGTMDFNNMRSLFNERSTTPTQQYNDSLEAKPIEVINTRPKNENTEDFSISSFLKNVLPASEPVVDPSGIPGLGLEVSETQVGSPQRSNYSHSPGPGQLPVTPIAPRMLNNQLSHSTPLPLRNLSAESHTPSPYSSQNSQSNVPFESASGTNVVNPLPPPPLPPPIFLDDENCYNKLPPKFPTWTPPNESIKEPAKWEEKGKNSMNPSWPGENDDKGKGLWSGGTNDRWDPGSESVWSNALRGKNSVLSETPESPPMYEKSGFTDPVEYDDSQTQEPLLSSAGDVDHRVIPVPMAGEGQLPYRLMKNADVDHRNLISLTGSPANHNSVNESGLSMPNNNLWSTSDRDYRQHMQPGDIVESVDMEMSDDETEGKQKGRVLVDLRSQDRDMRVPVSSQSSAPLDMDMRMIPLPPSAQMAGCRGQMMPDVHGMHAGPPPPPPPQFCQGQPSNFHQQQPDFRHGRPVDFHPAQSNFHPGQQPPPPPPLPPPPPPNFLHGSEFHGQPQDFHQIAHGQNEFRPDPQQDFDFHESQRVLRPGPDFHNDPQMRPRFAQPGDHQHRDSPGFHRNERGGRGGRMFGMRNRRDRYSDDHGSQQRPPNGRKPRAIEDQHQHPPGDMHPNNRSTLLKPPDTVVILDDEGVPIGMPENDVTYPDGSSENAKHPRDVSEHQQQQQQPYESESIASDRKSSQQSQNESADSERMGFAPGTSDYDGHAESATESGNPEKSENVVASEEQRIPGSEAFDGSPRQLSEQLEALMNSAQQSSNDLKRAATNGGFDGTEDVVGVGGEDSPSKKRAHTNGPSASSHETGTGTNGPPGCSSPDSQLGAGTFDYEGHSPAPGAVPGFRPRLGAPGVFPPWRGGMPGRSRPGFRGGPRAPWMDRGPRGPPPGGAFVPRGLKRGGQFRAGGFRARGRGGSNW